MFWVVQDREGSHQQKGRDSEDGGDVRVRLWRFCHNALQRANDISAVTKFDESGVRRGPFDAGRCQWKELDIGLHLLNRALPFLVGLAGVTSPRSQEIPGTALRYVVYMLLWGIAVLSHRCLHGERPSSLDLSLRRRALHHPLCGNNPALKLYAITRVQKARNRYVIDDVTVWLLCF